MKLHPRYFIVRQAKLELDSFLLDLAKKHDLTYAELFGMLGERITDLAKYAIRTERHPEDPNRKGDEE